MGFMFGEENPPLVRVIVGVVEFWSDEGTMHVIRHALFCGELDRACECCGLSSLVISCMLSKLVVLYSII